MGCPFSFWKSQLIHTRIHKQEARQSFTTIWAFLGLSVAIADLDKGEAFGFLG